MSAKNHIYFWIIVALIGFVMLAEKNFSHVDSKSNLKNQFQNRVDNLIEDGDELLLSIENQLRKNQKVINFNLPESYELFLYDRSNLEYWSTTDFSFEHKSILLKSDRRFLVKNEFGYFLVFKGRSLQKTVALVLPLVREYEIKGNQFLSQSNTRIFGKHKCVLYSSNNNSSDDFILHLGDENLYVRMNEIFVNEVFVIFYMVLLVFALWLILLTWNTSYSGIIYLTLVRLIYHFIPIAETESILFNPAVFASSFVHPNLFQLFLNSISIFILARFLIIKFKSRFSIHFLLFSFISFLQFVILNDLIKHSSLELTPYKLISGDYVTIVLSIVVVSHITLTLLVFKEYLLKVNIKAYQLLLGVLFITLFYFLQGEIYFFYFLFLLLFVVLKWLSKSDFLNVALGAFILILASSYSITDKNYNVLKSQQVALLGKLATGDDPYLEYLINSVSEQIAKDKIILTKLKSPFSSSNSFIKQKVEKVYLKENFPNYAVDIEIIPIENIVKNQNTLAINDEKIKVSKTKHTDLYKMTGSNNDYIKLVCFDDLLLKNICLRFNRLTSNKLNTSRGYISGIGDEISYSANFSYLVYNNSRIITQSGNLYDFLNVSQVLDSVKLTNYVSIVDAEHIKLNVGENNIIVSFQFSYWKYYINIASLLTILVVLIILIYIIVSIAGSRTGFKLSERLQIVFTLTLVVLFFLMIFATVTSISNNNEHQLANENLKKSQLIAESISSLLYTPKLDKAEIEKKIKLLADNNQVEIHLYNKDGSLIISTQNEVFDKNLKSSLLDYDILVNPRKELKTDYVGDFKYLSAYYPVKALNGNLLGFVNVPFFQSEEGLENSINQLSYSAIKLSLIILIIVLVITYYLSLRVSKPIALLSDRIEKIDLEHDIESIEWKSDDEIGKLVKSYNDMLIKLVDSKTKLKQKEKEEAWKEMAKQVAHEIKNPLTPMKLSLQFLLNKLNSSGEVPKSEVEQTTNTLLNQVENLSGIVESFSEFASMPRLEKEKTEITTIIKNVADLHSHLGNIQFHCNDNYYVDLDKNAFSGIISNLVINGIQSVEGKNPEIEIIFSEKTEDVLLISIKDNGEGIPDEIRDKVFTPNFSTKYSGSGIGLALAKKGIEEFEGKIWFETKLKAGTTFYIELPLSR